MEDKLPVLGESDEVIEIIETGEDEITEEYAVEEIEEYEEYKKEYVKPPEPKPRIYWEKIAAALALVLAAIALIVAVKTPRSVYIIEEADGAVSGTVVNDRLETLIRKGIAENVPETVRIKDVEITVELFGGEPERKIVDLSDLREEDRVTAKVALYPKESVFFFARDCRAVLDAMAQTGVIFDGIEFSAEDMYSSYSVSVNGRFRPDITVEELTKDVFYFGNVKLEEDLPDIS